MEYLDREGGKYLATKLKSYVDNKVTDLPSGTVDLTNYYTKEETDQLLANLPSGGTGTKGDKGDAGVGVSSIKSVNYELIITLTDGTVHNLGNIRGEKGAQGEKGADGINGTNGTDGVSPTVSVTETTNGHTVAITDVNGTQSFDVLNGKDGKDGASGGSSSGGSSGGASGITYAYDTEIATGDTWIDGKPIYLKVFHIDGLSSQPSASISMNTYHQQDIFADQIVSYSAIWNATDSNGDRYLDGSTITSPAPVATSSNSVGNSVNSYIVSRELWIQINNYNLMPTPVFSISVGRGQYHYTASCDVFVKYTKL